MNEPNQLPAVLTPEEVAHYMRRPLTTIWAVLRRGEIPSSFVGRRYRVRRSDVEALFHGSSAIPPTALPAVVVLPDRVERLGRPGRPRTVPRPPAPVLAHPAGRTVRRAHARGTLARAGL
jgi:excisionase family DNA binding protein